MMRKHLWLVVAAALLVVAITASTAQAAVNVKTEPRITFSGATATLTAGNFSGLGNVPASAELTVTGEATFFCTNPSGSNQPPGQNPVPAESGSSGPVDLGNSDHNGRGTVAGITAEVEFPPTPTPQEVGCGGKGSTAWTVEEDELTATDAVLVITQPEGGTVVYCRTFTLGGPATGTPC
jgi:hypothetical protein